MLHRRNNEEIISFLLTFSQLSTLEKSTDSLAELLWERFGLDPTKKALREALGQAFDHLNRQHSQWVAANFDASFFEPIAVYFLEDLAHQLKGKAALLLTLPNLTAEGLAA